MSGDPYEDAWAVNGNRGGEVWGTGGGKRSSAPPDTGLNASLAAVTVSQTRCNSGASHTQILISSSSSLVPLIHSSPAEWERGQLTPEPRSGPAES